MIDRSSSRRSFLRTTGLASLGAAEASGLGFLQDLPPVSADDSKPQPQAVRFLPEIEPTVRLLEETPRDELLEVVASRLRRGLSYRELLAALLLAGVRNVQPRPYVGFKFHAVLVVNSAHIASMSSPPADRWLPIFWALDYFKQAQAQDVREGNWTMAPVKEAPLPKAQHAHQAFRDAMDAWDEEAADRAAASLARNFGAASVFELFWRYGSRDYRSIGHKAIYVANSWRTLQCIGWQHAEPVLRSLTYALLQHEGDNPSKRDAEADRSWKSNYERVRKLGAAWGDKQDGGATQALVKTARTGSADACADLAAELMSKGVSPQSLWDGIFSGAGDLLLRQPAIVPLHAVTTANAMHHAYRMAHDSETCRLLLLQAAAFLPQFRASAAGRSELGKADITDLQAADKIDGGVDEVFAERRDGVSKALGYLAKTGDAKSLVSAARRLVFLKGNDAHDYKFSSAVLEDWQHISPALRHRYLASSMVLLPSAEDNDNPLVERVRNAFGRKV